MRHALFGDRASADQSVLGLEEDLHAGGDIVRDQGRDPDAEVDQHPGAELLRYASRDDFLCVHGLHPLVTRKSTNGAGVTTWSGEIRPVGTILSAVTMVVLPAIAMMGLKLRAVSAYDRLPR